MAGLTTALKKAKKGQQSTTSQIAGISAPKIARSYANAATGKNVGIASIAGIGTNPLTKAFVVRTKKVNVPARVTNMGKIKGIIGTKRLNELQKAVKNRNARMRRQTAKITGEKYTYENYLKLVRGQYLPPVVRVDLSKITSVKDYNALMRMLEADKTPAWKADRLNAMREWLKKSVKRSIWIDEEDDPELFERIDTMSEKEILEYRRNYKGLIKDIFDYYVDDQAIDADDRDVMWVRIRRALGLTGEIGANPIISI